MNRKVVYGGYAALLCGIAIWPVADRPMALVSSGQAKHGPINPHHHADGTLKRGLHNEISSGNWSGFAVANFQTGQIYSSASATWQIPSASYVPFNGTSNWEYLANWVGIGGYCENSNCTSADNTLIQLGTEASALNTNGAIYDAWYELLPMNAQPIPHPVKPGDIITASLQCTAGCSPASTQIWVLAMSDETAGWTWSETFQYQTGMGSAEWVTEAPYSAGILPLADYVQANFDPVSANGGNPNLSLSTNGIVMEDPWGQTSNPSSPLEGQWFSTCWGNGTTLTPCTAAAVAASPPPPTPPSASAPTAALSANPTTVSLGQKSTLTWSSTSATSCAGGGFTASGTSGSTQVLPFGTTNYSLTCTGTGGTAMAETTVHVNGPFF